MTRHGIGRNSRLGLSVVDKAILGIVAAVMLAGCSLIPAPTEGPVAETTPGETAVPTLEPTPTPFKAELVICARNEPDVLIGSASPASAAISALVAGQVVTYSAAYEA